MPTRLQLARREIIEFFENRETRVYRQRELEVVLLQNREEWRLAQGMAFKTFLEYLLQSRKLRRLEFGFPHRKEVRYAWGETPLESVLLSLKPNCHFSHYTAMQLHDLTEQDPRTVYVNHEQRPKPISAGGLSQERIDLAFRRKPRMTKNLAKVKGAGRRRIRICLLNGKHTGYLGVEEREVSSLGESTIARVRLTDLERTLIDIAVRPFYAGGVAEVLKAYERAADRASLNRLAGMLRKLGHVYPYHQAIGFYLEAAGAYDPRAIALFRGGFEYEFDFYLAYGMEETEYVPSWHVHVPRGLSRIA